MNAPRGLRDDEKALLASAGGFAAFQVLLELLRAGQRYIEGAEATLPAELVKVPELRARFEFERANYRMMAKEAKRVRGK